ncbi:MAG: hypothetical protein HY791_31875 [Deltaproteobacteria bacterium]|nr:hypothetical protein [Deltaproteobacteria bacterium]
MFCPQKHLVAPLIFAAACAPTSRSSIPAGSVVLAAVLVDQVGTVLAVDRSDLALADENMRVLSFVVERDELISKSGAPLTEEELLELVVRRRTEAAVGSCGFCTASASEAPQVLFEGDGCPPPSFARAYVDGRIESEAWIEQARKSVRIDRRGPCPVRAKPQPTASLEVVTIWPRSGDSLLPFEDANPPEAVAQNARGTVGYFSRERVTLYPEAGGPIRASTLPFDGPVLAAAGMANSFLVASWDINGHDLVRYDLFDDSSQPTSLGYLPIPGYFVPNSMIYLPPDDVLLLGKVAEDPGGVKANSRAGLARCALRPPDFECQVVMDAEWPDVPRQPFWQVAGAVAHPSGVYVSMSVFEGQIVAGPFQSPPLFRAQRLADVVPEVWTEGGLVLQGDRLYACGQSEGGISVLTATLSATQISDFSVAGEFPGMSCLGFSAIAGEPAKRRLWLQSSCASLPCQHSIDLSPDLGPDLRSPLGLIRRDFAQQTMGIWLQSVSSPQPSWTLAADRAGGLYRSTLSTGSVDRPFGVAPTEVRVADVVLGEELLVLAQHEIRRFSPDGEIFLGTLPVSFDFELVRVAKDSARGVLLVVGHEWTSDLPKPRLGRLDPTTGEWNEIPLPGVAGRLLDVAETSPGHHVVVGDDWLLMRVSGESTEAVRVLWDDPSTTNEEGRPGSDPGCEDHPSRTPGDPSHGAATWRAIGAAEGIAWAGGCSAVIARVPPFGPAQRLRIPPELSNPDDRTSSPRFAVFNSIGVLDRGWVLAGAKERRNLRTDLTHLIELELARRDGGEDIAIRLMDGYELPPHQSHTVLGPIVQILPESPGPTLVTAENQVIRGAVDRLGGAERLTLMREAPRRAVSLPGGRMAVLAAHDRLFLMR